MKKRHLIIGVLALELLAFPIAALGIHQIEFSVPTNVINASIESPPGQLRYFVNSNGPFVITTENYQGHILTESQTMGKIGAVEFGQTAQAPGVPVDCRKVETKDKSVVYKAHQGTILNAGKPMEETVLISIYYEGEVAPTVTIEAISENNAFQDAKTCT